MNYQFMNADGQLYSSNWLFANLDGFDTLANSCKTLFNHILSRHVMAAAWYRVHTQRSAW